MLDTLLLRPSLHFTALSFGLTPFKFPNAPFHLTSLHFTTLHLTSLHFTALLPRRWFSPHFYSFHFTPFIIAFLTLFLKILGLQGKVRKASAGSWFQFLMVLFTKEKKHRLKSFSNLIQFPLLEISLHNLAYIITRWWGLILETVVVRLVYTTGMASDPTINSWCLYTYVSYHFQNKQDGQCSCNIETRSCNHWCSGKSINIIYILDVYFHL